MKIIRKIILLLLLIAILPMNNEVFASDINQTDILEETIPYKVKKVEDPELEKGETVIIRKGVDGLKKIERIRIYDAERNLKDETYREVGVVIEPVNEIISIGTKVAEHIEQKEEKLYYSKTISYNYTLPTSHNKLIQKGVDGIVKRTYVNGVLDASKDVIIKEPVGEIVEVGMNTDASETIVETKKEPEVINETKKENIRETGKEDMKETRKETSKKAISTPKAAPAIKEHRANADSTIKETKNEAVVVQNETIDSPDEESTHESTKETITESILETVNEIASETGEEGDENDEPLAMTEPFGWMSIGLFAVIGVIALIFAIKQGWFTD